MDLVDEENRLTPHLQALLRFVDDFAHARDSFSDGGERNELAVGVLRDKPSQRCLPGAWRTPEHHRLDVARFYRRPQGFAGCEQVLLPDKFLERARTHPGGERLRRVPRAEERFFAAVDVGRSLAEFLRHWVRVTNLLRGASQADDRKMASRDRKHTSVPVLSGREQGLFGIDSIVYAEGKNLIGIRVSRRVTMRLMRPSYVASLVLLFAAYGCGDSTSPQPLPSVSIVSGDAQQVPLGQTEPAPLIVAVTAPNGDPMPGVQVNWGIVSGGGSLSATSSMTDQSGHASVTWTLGSSGPQVVKAWADLDRTEPVNFSANPVSVAVTMVSGDAQKGPFAMALPAPLIVSVKTVGGTPLPNVKVNWGVAAGGGSLSSASSLTDQNGNASITWTLGPSPNVGQSAGAWTDIEGSPKVTFSATAEKLLVLHYDGNSWTQSLLTQNTGMSLDAGWAASTSKAFAGGTSCPNPLSYDSGVWSGMDACNGNSLRVTSIWGTAPSDVWAVGTGHGARISDPSFAWIYHFDGSAWTVSYTDGDASHPPELLAVGTRSTDDVIAVGKNGRIIRHAGQQWNEQTSGTTNDLLAVWGDPHSANVFAVGNAGTIV